MVATDASEAMIAEAKRAVARTHLRNVRCLCMDAQELDFASESFDAVIARNVLMFTPDLSRALAETRRVLRVAHRMSATVWSSARANPRLSGPLQAARALGIRPTSEATFRIALRLGAPNVLASALRRAGFHEIEYERIPVVATYNALDEAVQQTMEHGGTQELLAMLPGGSEARMRAYLSARWQQFSGSGGVRLPGEQLVFAATR